MREPLQWITKMHTHNNPHADAHFVDAVLDVTAGVALDAGLRMARLPELDDEFIENVQLAADRSDWLYEIPDDPMFASDPVSLQALVVDLVERFEHRKDDFAEI